MKDWMTLTYRLWFKEVSSIITRPLFFLITGFYLLLSGWLFFNYLAASEQLTDVSLEMAVLKPFVGNMNFIFLFLAPLFSMKAFSEERKDGTLNLLFLSRLTNIQIISAKFLALLSVSVLMIGVLLVYPLMLSFSGFSNWSIILSGYSGLLFSCCCFYSVGLFFSSLTKNQIISALGSYVSLMLIMLLVVSSSATKNILVAQILQYLSFSYHFEQFALGVIPSYSFIYLFSFVGFFFVLTNFSLQSRKW